MRKKMDCKVGDCYHRWKVISKSYKGVKGRLYAKVECVCGTQKALPIYRLKSGHCKSCGCLKRDLHTKHGVYGTHLYYAWGNMIQRCQNPKASEYRRYGGKGITVCKSWKTDFRNFQRWALANGYNDTLTIDRINRNKGYSPGNCRWATRSQQNCNKISWGRSGFKGVYANRDKWIARITLKGKQTHLGTFDTPEKAAKAYNKAAPIHHGEFARLNLIGYQHVESCLL